LQELSNGFEGDSYIDGETPVLPPSSLETPSHLMWPGD